MSTTEFDDFDHASHMQRALELAEKAFERGDEPFGSVLVRDDEVVMEASNAIHTDNDLRHHPELDLATRAHAAYEPEARAEMVMYASTEPCPMCASGIRTAGLGRVVFSVRLNEFLVDIAGQEPLPVTAPAILADRVPVVGPVLGGEGRELLRRAHE
jgi:tRNA(Arg) A34 adenosine deaminase TadA